MPLKYLDRDKDRHLPDSKKLVDMENTDLFGLLAYSAGAQKENIVFALMEKVKEGDPAALRLLERAFNEIKPQDEKNRPIPILGGITQTKHVHRDNSPEENPRA